MTAQENRYSESPEQPPQGLGALLVAALPLLLGLVISGTAGMYVAELALFLFGGPPHGTQGYYLLGLVLLPLMVSMAITEWRLSRWQRLQHARQ